MSVPVRQRRVFIVIRALPAELGPIFPVRHLDTTVLFTDPRTTMLSGVQWMVDNATLEERNAVRAGYGYGPVGTPLPPEALEGMCWPVPEILLPPGVEAPAAGDTRRLRAEARFLGLVGMHQRMREATG